MAKTNQNVLEARIHEIITSAAHAIAAAVRHDFAGEVQNLLEGGHSNAGAQSHATRAAAAPKAAQKASPRKAGRKAAGKFNRRSPEEIAAENAKLLNFVRANPGRRSEEILKALGMPKPVVASGLQRLRDENKVKMTGVKRAATYTAA